nr:SPFH domain-containing protein [Methanopyrus sp. SNP6]
MIVSIVVGGVLALLVLAASVRIVNQYERGVLLRLRRYIGIREPGLNFIVPFIDKMIKVDLRVVTQNIPAQEVITKDNVPIKVDAVIYYRAVDPASAVMNVEDYGEAVFNLAQTTLRSVLGEVDLDDIFSEAGGAERTYSGDRRREDGGMGNLRHRCRDPRRDITRGDETGDSPTGGS